MRFIYIYIYKKKWSCKKERAENIHSEEKYFCISICQIFYLEPDFSLNHFRKCSNKLFYFLEKDELFQNTLIQLISWNIFIHLSDVLNVFFERRTRESWLHYNINTFINEQLLSFIFSGLCICLFFTWLWFCMFRDFFGFVTADLYFCWDVPLSFFLTVCVFCSLNVVFTHKTTPRSTCAYLKKAGSRNII